VVAPLSMFGLVWFVFVAFFFLEVVPFFSLCVLGFCFFSTEVVPFVPIFLLSFFFFFFFQEVVPNVGFRVY
jgi:hypothetical protein